MCLSDMLVLLGDVPSQNLDRERDSPYKDAEQMFNHQPPPSSLGLGFHNEVNIDLAGDLTRQSLFYLE